MILNETLTIHLCNIIKIEKLTSEYCFLSTLLSPFTALFMKWTQQHEKIVTTEAPAKICSINNTALFDNRVNKPDASEQNFHCLTSFPNNLFTFFQAGSYKIYIFFIAVAEKRTPSLLWKYDKPQNDKVSQAPFRQRCTWLLNETVILEWIILYSFL